MANVTIIINGATGVSYTAQGEVMDSALLAQIKQAADALSAKCTEGPAASTGLPAGGEAAPEVA